MAKTPSAFVAHVEELLESVKGARIRAMFGGYGVSLDGVSFGLIADDVLYLRTDAQTVDRYDALNLPPFRYPGKKGVMTMQSYRRAPDECLDDARTLGEWAKEAVAAARRAKAPAPKKASKATTATMPVKRAAKKKRG